MSDKKEAPTAADLERQLAALREDFAGVVSLLRTMAEDRAGDAASRARGTADDAVERARESRDALADEAARRGREARAAVDSAVHNNPLVSVGAAMALGFALGALTRR